MTPPAAPAWKWWLAVVVAMAFPTLATWTYFVLLPGGWAAQAPPRPLAADNPAQQAAFLLAKVIEFAFPVLVVWHLAGRFPWPSLPTGAGMLIGLGFGLLTTAAMLGLYFFLLRDTPAFELAAVRVLQKVREMGLTTPLRYVLFGVAVSFGHSLLEEYYWRWFIFGGLRRLLAFWPAVVLSSVAFAAHHVVLLGLYFPGWFWAAAVPFSLCVAVGGAVWAWLFERSGSVYPCWVGHIFIDAGIFVIGYFLCFGPGPG